MRTDTRYLRYYPYVTCMLISPSKVWARNTHYMWQNAATLPYLLPLERDSWSLAKVNMEGPHPAPRMFRLQSKKWHKGLLKHIHMLSSDLLERDVVISGFHSYSPIKAWDFLLKFKVLIMIFTLALRSKYVHCQNTPQPHTNALKLIMHLSKIRLDNILMR